jgi:hypothetical protein
MQKVKPFLILLITLIIISCNKDEDPAYSYRYNKISESLHPLLFDIDSYWIYENPDNLLVDSVVIVDFKIDTFKIGPGGSGQGPIGEEQYFNLTYSSIVSGEYEEQLIGYIISRGLVYGGYIYLASHNIGDESLNARISAAYDSLDIYDVVYRDVIKMEIHQDEYIDSDMNLYFVDSIGIIRKEIVKDDLITETWDLLRFNAQLYSIE